MSENKALAIIILLLWGPAVIAILLGDIRTQLRRIADKLEGRK